LNKRERIEAVVRHKAVDRIPWTIYRSIAPWGATELQCRNAGLSLCYQHFPICRATRPNVEVREEAGFVFDRKQGRKVVTRTFITPVGEVSSIHEIMGSDRPPAPGDLIRRFGSEVDQEDLSWIRKYPFSKASDYEVLKYIVEDTVYDPNYEKYKKTDRLVGSEGVVMANVVKSPFQSIVYELMGPERCFLEFNDNPKRFQSLYELIFEKQKEIYKIAANSPATIVWCPDNITGPVTPPTFFKEFCLPFYNEIADLLHEKNKVLAVHMDGQLRSLVDLIAQTRIDVIEAFTPPPMADLSIKEAKTSWKDKIIWCNFPEVLIGTCDAERIENYMIKLLKTIAPGDNFLLGCTENFPLDGWEVGFKVLANVLDKYGEYPVHP